MRDHAYLRSRETVTSGSRRTRSLSQSRGTGTRRTPAAPANEQTIARLAPTAATSAPGLGLTPLHLCVCAQGACESVSVCASVCVCVHLCVCVCASVRARMCAYVHTRAHTSARVCVGGWECARARVCVCLCSRVCLCVRARVADTTGGPSYGGQVAYDHSHCDRQRGVEPNRLERDADGRERERAAEHQHHLSTAAAGRAKRDAHDTRLWSKPTARRSTACALEYASTSLSNL